MNDFNFDIKTSYRVTVIDDAISKIQKQYDEEVSAAVVNTVQDISRGTIYEEIALNKEKVLEALGKTNPREPIRYPEIDNGSIREYFCPACRVNVIMTNNYCPWCGQKLKWNKR